MPSRTSSAIRCLAAALLATLSHAPHVQAQGAAPKAAPSAAASPPAALTVRVPGYRIEGNSLLTTQELLPRLEGFTGTVSMAQMRAAAAAVQAAYREAGYGAVVAFLPEQELSGGNVLIRVVEGRLQAVNVKGASQFTPDNVKASLPSLAVGKTPLVRRIDAEIQMANENPAKNVQVLLQPGAGLGEVVAEVAVVEKPVLRATGRLDNTGSKATGRARAALGAQYANVAGADHVAALELQTAPQDPSAVRVLSGSYRVPVYGRSMALDGYFALSEVDAASIATAAGDLQLSGRGRIFGARASLYLPRRANVDQRLIAGLEAREYLNNCTIAGLPQAACGVAGASVSVQPVSLTYLLQSVGDSRWGLSLGLQGNAGLGGRHGSDADFDAVRSGASRRYLMLRYAAQWALPLGEWASAGARISGQAAARPLVPGEMFGAGGSVSVRGYEERELVGDRGYFMTFELTGPVLGSGGSALPGLDLRPVAFIDGGQVSNADDAQCRPGRTRCGIAGLGIGLRGRWQQWQLRLDVARPLTDGLSTLKGDVRGHVSLVYNP